MNVKPKCVPVELIFNFAPDIAMANSQQEMLQYNDGEIGVSMKVHALHPNQ